MQTSLRDLDMKPTQALATRLLKDVSPVMSLCLEPPPGRELQSPM